MSVSTQSNSGLIAANLNAVMREDSLSSITSLLQMSKYIVNGTPSADPARVLPPNSADCHAALPWLGLHRGRGAVKNFLAHMRNLEETTFGPREVISEGNKAAAFGWFRPHALSTGRTVDISVFENPDSAHRKAICPRTRMTAASKSDHTRGAN